MHVPQLSASAHLPARWILTSVLAAPLLAACGGGGSGSSDGLLSINAVPQLGAASPSTIQSCADLISKFSFANTTISTSTDVAAGTLIVAGKAVRAHCRVTGTMFNRVSTVDGVSYAIGFEMRLPNDWNGRFYYQANGGTDGSVVTATGGINGGNALDNALNMGFAVASSDAGHGSTSGSTFGIDPQARLDYGYQAVGKLTPMAKGLIQSAYGRAPDRSYIGGCSNGGRHTMVAASRYAAQYDGYLVGDPGYRLPLAAIANIAGGQAYAKLATTAGDLSTGFTTAERTVVNKAILGKCDALDGATDGLVQDTGACQAAFNLERDVPTCSGARDGTCLSSAQKTAIAGLFSGATTATGKKIYSSFPYDAGFNTNGWATWKFSSPLTRDSGAVAQIWGVPPVATASFNGTTFALTSVLDDLVTSVNATSTLYTESAMSFMVPPNASDLSTLRNRGAKLMLYHGTADPIFSSDDSTTWFDSLRDSSGLNANIYARYYRVPGMNHCSGGPATDQFDMLTPLVNWVEKGQVPEAVVATARGTGNAAAVNTDVPADWAANRTRPLCVYPKVARYNGSGDLNDAANFSCK